MRRRDVWIQRLVTAISAVAVVQIGVGLAGLVAAALGAEWVRATSLPIWQRALVIVGFGWLAGWLLLGGRRDARVRTLAALFLVTALFFARPPMAALGSVLPDALFRVVEGLRSLTIDAFLPVLVWLFVRDFPSALDSVRMRRVVRMGLGSSLVLACLLLLSNVAVALFPGTPLLTSLAASSPTSPYWALLFGSIVPALVVFPIRCQLAPPEERRRVGLFLSGLLTGAVAPFLIAILSPVPAFQDAFRDAVTGPLIRLLNLLSLLLIGVTTSYAVLVQKVLDVRTVIRKAAQYALARIVIAALAGIPFAAVGVILYRGRREAVADLFSGTRLLAIVALLVAGFVVLQLRLRVMAFVDRLFFREVYDARQVLAGVVERSRTAHSTSDLVAALTGEVERALHPTSVALLVEAKPDGPFVALRGAARVLERSAELVALLERERAPLRVDLERLAPPFDALPESDRVWLADADAEALVPLVRSDGGVAGLLVLGPKQSELRYTRDDLLLLAAIGASAGLSLENLLLRDSARLRRDPAAQERLAAECVACGRVEAPDTAACDACGSATRGARLPRVLFDKFELEARVGEGAMGVVYRARDLALGRAVALKTLPETSPEDSVRLRREARAMASIRHPHLAVIFGAESWQGDPILVIEYLARGTLADRLARERLSPAEALRLGATLAAVLDTVHRSSLLHRDVKPSNIGYTEDGTLKLLDFGLARIAGDAGASFAPSGAANAAMGEFAGGSRSAFAGTPLYMSPEALWGEPPEVGFDLWSLSVVVFEAMTGRHPFEHASSAATLDAIRNARTLEVRALLPDCPSAIPELFARILARDRSARPATARDLAGVLLQAEAELSAAPAVAAA